MRAGSVVHTTVHAPHKSAASQATPEQYRDHAAERVLMHLKSDDSVLLTTDANARVDDDSDEEKQHAAHYEMLLTRLGIVSITAAEEAVNRELHTFCSTAKTKMQLNYIAASHSISAMGKPMVVPKFANMCEGEDHYLWPDG